MAMHPLTRLRLSLSQKPLEPPCTNTQFALRADLGTHKTSLCLGGVVGPSTRRDRPRGGVSRRRFISLLLQILVDAPPTCGVATGLTAPGGNSGHRFGRIWLL